MIIHPAGTQLFRAVRRTDERTDRITDKRTSRWKEDGWRESRVQGCAVMTKLRVLLRVFAKAPIRLTHIKQKGVVYTLEIKDGSEITILWRTNEAISLIIDICQFVTSHTMMIQINKTNGRRFLLQKTRWIIFTKIDSYPLFSTLRHINMVFAVRETSYLKIKSEV